MDSETGAPLSRAHVTVHASEWGSLTTDSGRFLLCGFGSGIHRVTIERLGYVTLHSWLESDPAGESVTLRMQPDPVLLEGLEIVSDRFERRRRAVATPVRAYDEEQLASSMYWSAAEFVDSRPGVMVTPCGIDRCIYSAVARSGPRCTWTSFR